MSAGLVPSKAVSENPLQAAPRLLAVQGQSQHSLASTRISSVSAFTFAGRLTSQHLCVCIQLASSYKDTVIMLDKDFVLTCLWISK